MNYNLTRCIISDMSDLSEMDLSNTKIYYRLSEIDFYFKKQDENDRLIITFHGFGGIDCPKPIFRGYNWDYNVLAISDKLLELFPELGLAWYLSSKKYDFQKIYIDIIDYFVQKYTNIIFVGSSGGGFPALLYSCYFHKKAFIQSAQLYLDKYQYTFNVDNHQLDKITERLEMEQSESKEMIHGAEQIVQRYGLPSLAYIYCNTRDERHHIPHFCRFQEFVRKQNISSHFRLIDFYGKDLEPPQTDHHQIQTPPHLKHAGLILDELFEQ